MSSQLVDLSRGFGMFRGRDRKERCGLRGSHTWLSEMGLGPRTLNDTNGLNIWKTDSVGFFYLNPQGFLRFQWEF